jgi:hypothetical protein
MPAATPTIRDIKGRPTRELRTLLGEADARVLDLSVTLKATASGVRRATLENARADAVRLRDALHDELDRW